MIKNIIKGRSPTMRHVSRTHRVAVGSLFDRFNFWTTKSKSNMLTPKTNSFFRTESRVSCPKELKASTSKEGSAMATPRAMKLVSRNLLSAKKTLPQDSSASNSPGNHELDQSFVSPSVRKLATKTQQRFLKRGNKMTLNLLAPGNWCRVVNLQAEPASGHWSEVVTFKSEGQGRNPTIDTFRKTSRTC